MVGALYCEYKEPADMLEGQQSAFEKLLTEHLKHEEIILNRINHPNLQEIIQINKDFRSSLTNLDKEW